MRPATVPAVGKRPPEKAVALPRVVISNGTLEALKWLGLVLMTLDHANKYVFAHTLPGAFELGRLAMPIFAFVLAYNLARPGAMASGAHARTMKRLALAGVVATPFFIGLGGLVSGWPLNIMFTLCLSTGVVYLVEKGGFARRAGATALFLVGGLFVEYWWFAVAFTMAAWWYFRTANKMAVAVCALPLVALFVVNKNLWALAAVPLMLAAPLVACKVPRSRHAFYAYYPAHLALLWTFTKGIG